MFAGAGWHSPRNDEEPADETVRAARTKKQEIEEQIKERGRKFPYIGLPTEEERSLLDLLEEVIRRC